MKKFNNQLVIYLPDADKYYLPVYFYGMSWDDMKLDA